MAGVFVLIQLNKTNAMASPFLVAECRDEHVMDDGKWNFTFY
jgi:hypothetical protein